MSDERGEKFSAKDFEKFAKPFEFLGLHSGALAPEKIPRVATPLTHVKVAEVLYVAGSVRKKSKALQTIWIS